MAEVERRTGAAALAGLRSAYAGEVARRLPLLTAAAGELAERDLPSARDVVRTHAHTFASCSVVVGEIETARAASECELLADTGDLGALTDRVHTLIQLLRPWSVGSTPA